MGYRVLLTIDLPGANDEQQKIFYDELLKIKLKKVKTLTTAWRISFADEFDNLYIIGLIKTFLEIAKRESNIDRVEYAMQLSKSDVVISTL